MRERGVRGRIVIVCALLLCTALTVVLIGGRARETYGIVARLGSDTISIEHISRARRTVNGEVAERSPRAMRKSWTAELDDAGRVRRFTIDTRMLNPLQDEPDLTRTDITFGRDSIITTERSGSETKRTALPRTAVVNAPWNTYVYGTYELLLADASRVGTDTVAVHQFIPGYGLGHGVVRRRADGSLTFNSTRLSGTGIAQLDSAGRLVSYDGRNTTYRQLVERTTDQPDIDAIAARFAAREKQGPGAWLSPRDTASGRIGDARIEVDYSRPLARGRTIIGDVVPYGRVWRTGANRATHLTTSAPIAIAGIPLEPGAYTLWTLPAQDGVTLIVNRQTGQWGTGYGPAHDVGRAPLQVAAMPAVTDTFTIAIDTSSSALVMQWDRFRWTAPITAR